MFMHLSNHNRTFRVSRRDGRSRVRTVSVVRRLFRQRTASATSRCYVVGVHNQSKVSAQNRGRSDAVSGVLTYRCFPKDAVFVPLIDTIFIPARSFPDMPAVPTSLILRGEKEGGTKKKERYRSTEPRALFLTWPMISAITPIKRTATKPRPCLRTKERDITSLVLSSRLVAKEL